MADGKIAYGASVQITIGLHTTPLASSTSLTGGRESTAIDNTSTKYLDALVSGKITTGTSPTDARSILIYVYASMEDTPTYPDVLDGTDSDETLTSAGIRNSGLKLAHAITTDNSSNRTYPVAPFSVAALFNNAMPKFWGLFITHDTGVALNSTGSNHAFHYTPVYETMA